MKRPLLLAFVCITFVNTLEFSIASGCGSFRAVPIALAWDAVRVCFGSFFADNHEHVVAGVGALLSAFFFTIFLALAALFARKRGSLVSRASLAKAFSIAVVIYLLLGLFPFPSGPCF